MITKPWAVALKDDRAILLRRRSGTDGKIMRPGNVLESFAIVTTEPNELLEPFHNRCPLIIEPKDYNR